MIIDQDIYLEHFGVKGMQWGVRKNRGRQGNLVEREAQKADKRVRKDNRRAVAVGIGSGVLAAMFVSGRLLSTPIVAIAGIGTGVIVSKFTANFLHSHGSRRVNTLDPPLTDKQANDLVKRHLKNSP